MKNASLTSFKIAQNNIKNKPVRTFLLTFLSGLLCFILFFSSFVIYSLKNGMTSLSNRIGADIIVVPEGYDSQISGAILRGEPNSFFFDKSVFERIRKIEGVKEATPQLFLATLSAGCCSFPIQVVGYDDETDFVVQPWLQKQVKKSLKEGEVIVGNNIVGTVHSQVKFFNQAFTIKGRLAKTGMGFDNTVFMSFDEVIRLAKEYKKILNLPSENQENMISSVMIKADKDVATADLKKAIDIEFKGEGVYSLLSKNMMNEIAKHADNMLSLIYILIVLIWLLVFAVFILVYSVSIRERKREIATLRVIGATIKKVKEILLLEVAWINFKGAVIGTGLSLAVTVLFSNALSQIFAMPFLEPNYILLMIFFFGVILICTLMGPLSVYVVMNKMLKKEIALVLRSND